MGSMNEEREERRRPSSYDYSRKEEALHHGGGFLNHVGRRRRGDLGTTRKGEFTFFLLPKGGKKGKEDPIGMEGSIFAKEKKEEDSIRPGERTGRGVLQEWRRRSLLSFRQAGEKSVGGPHEGGDRVAVNPCPMKQIERKKRLHRPWGDQKKSTGVILLHFLSNPHGKQLPKYQGETRSRINRSSNYRKAPGKEGGMSILWGRVGSIIPDSSMRGKRRGREPTRLKKRGRRRWCRLSLYLSSSREEERRGGDSALP